MYHLYATSPAPTDAFLEDIQDDERIERAIILQYGYLQLDTNVEPKGIFVEQLKKDYECLVGETVEELEKKLYGEEVK